MDLPKLNIGDEAIFRISNANDKAIFKNLTHFSAIVKNASYNGNILRWSYLIQFQGEELQMPETLLVAYVTKTNVPWRVISGQGIKI